MARSPSAVHEHAATVERWLERVVDGRTSTPELLAAFQRVLSAVWRRAVPTLGPVAVTAIADRVLRHAIARHPFFAAVHPDSDGELRCETMDLATTLGGVPFEELRAGVRTVLTELLAVLGSLTAQVLTPELQAELSRDRRVETP